MMEKNRKVLTGGLNADDTDFVVGESEYINAENIRWGTTDSGSIGHIEPIGSNTAIVFSLPAGTNICICSITDETKQRIIRFVWNSNGDHAIYAYDLIANVTRTVLLDTDVTGGLNFEKNSLITAVLVNNLMYWIDGNEPHKVNIEAAIKMNDGTYVTDEAAYTSPLEADVISLIRKPPEYPLVAGKFNDPALAVNNISDFAGQFACRVVFRDGEVSVLSPISNQINYNTITEDAADINYILVNFVSGASPHISQDVQQVDFCVRYGNSGNFYIIKSWNRDNADDSAEIDDHNSGTLGLQYKFLNDRVGIALDSAYSIKPYDSVPRRSKAIEFALGRLFLGNNLFGFNKPALTSLAFTQVSDTNTTFQNPVFKAGSSGKLGIIFRDDYKRIVGNVITNDTLRFQIPDRDYTLSTYIKHLAWTLSNTSAVDEIPIEATHYEVVITKSLLTRFFLQGKSKDTQYAIKDPVTGVISYNTAYAADRYGVAFDMSYILSEGLGYTYQDGDFLKLYISGGSTVYTLPVIGQDGQNVICKLENLGSFATQPDIIVEIFTPYKESANDPYYTTGATYDVNNAGTAFRTYDTVAGNITGDVYLFGRSIPSSSYVAENMSTNSKHWREWFGNYGEVNYVLASKEFWETNSIVWSNTYIQGTNTNGLSTFDALDKKQLPLEMGALYKLILANKIQEQGNVMLAICSDETASMYLGETQLVSNEGNSFVGTSGNVIGTVNVLRGSHGTLNPESVIEYRGNVYWFDTRNCLFIEYSVNGLDIISNFKLRRFTKLFGEKFKTTDVTTIEGYGGRPFIFAGIDKYHSELMWSLPKLEPTNPKGTLVDYVFIIDAFTIPYPYDFYDGAAKTIVYKVGAQKWVGAYSHTPEMFASLGSELYSVKNGNLWKHNDKTSTNNFYGTQYDSKLMLLCNAEPLDIKTFHNLAIEANIMPSFVHMRSEYPYIQSTDLLPELFKFQEGVWYASILRDRLSPGYTPSPTLPYDEIELLGDKIRNTALRIMLQWKDADLDEPFANFKLITFGYNKSHGHTV